MPAPVMTLSLKRLISLGLRPANTIYYQLTPEELVQQCLNRKEGRLTDTGALSIHTGAFTGRSPKDRFIVKDEVSSGTVDWGGFNQPFDASRFEMILKEITGYQNALPAIWIRDGYVCADPHFRMNIRIVNDAPAMNLFAHNMFLRPAPEEIASFKPEWHIFSAPGLHLDPEACGTRQSNAVIISFKHKIILAAGTGYTGEIKKSVFSVLNFILPHEKKVLSMHCAANKGKSGDTALFFGLSGTGKTTLSADPERRLIGDDEHGWTPQGIFNFEGGCYAKCIHLKEETEPAIYRAIRPGALLENIQFFPGTNRANFEDGSLTENTRVSYPLEFISNAVHSSTGGIPKNIFFLTCDASGILPPVSKLTPAQAMYQFISGYTAKIAGTETGITEPKSTFSACFGAPFMPLHPGVYAQMLGEKIRKEKVQVWLINTGWSGGAYRVGKRISLSYTRAIITAVLQQQLDQSDWEIHPVFKVSMPKTCPGLPSEILNPVNTWQDRCLYEKSARELANRFIDNFKQYEKMVSAEIREGGPILK
jgi:phosphoenolpyruvate carboxykinase (ATP)